MLTFSKAIWIRMSQYGLGAYPISKVRVLNTGRICWRIHQRRNWATRNVRIFDFAFFFVICLQTGPRIQKFLGLNYSFTLTENITLDSHAVGNETRYLNHATDPNCYAKGKNFAISDYQTLTMCIK